MRRIIATALMAVVAFGFGAAGANEHPPRYSDADCANAQGEGGGMAVVTWQGADEEGRSEPLRAALCVNDGQVDREDDPETEEDESQTNNGAELYVGGEIDTESSENFSCGAIEVMGMQGLEDGPEDQRLIFGDEDWGGSNCQ